MEVQWQAILVLHAHRKKKPEIARELGCSKATMYRMIQRGTPKAPKRIRTRTVRTPETIEAIRKAIEDARGKATKRGLARLFGMVKQTMTRLVEEDLGLKVFKRTPRQALKPIDWVKRKARCLKMLHKLKKREVVILFSDETPFSLGEMVANKTGFYLAKGCKERLDNVIHYGKEWHFVHLQVLAVVVSDGSKCPLIFLEDGERLTAATYKRYLRTKVFLWAKRKFGKKWWWRQDGASCHACLT